MGVDVFVYCHNVEIYALEGTVHVTFYSGRSPWWSEYRSGSVFSAPTAAVFSYYSCLVLRPELRQGAVWSITVIYFTISPVFRFLGACRDDTVGLTCHDDCICRNRQSALVPLAPKVCQHVNET